MKKIFLVTFFLLCGCSNKLTCSYKTNYDDIKINNKIVFNFDTNTLEQIDKMIFSDSISAGNYFNEIVEYKEEYNLTLDKNVITSMMNGEIKIDGDKKEIKEKYEGYDYICK